MFTRFPRPGSVPFRLLLALALVSGAAATRGDALEDAKRANRSGDHAQALRLLRPLAERGDPKAQVQLGVMYFHGQGVREDDAQAFAWFERAAQLGDAVAQYHLGNMYAFGHGVPREVPDPDRMAARWYFEAAQQDNADAQYALGILFISGKGVVQSPDEAAKWFRRAANNGHADAQRFLRGMQPPR